MMNKYCAIILCLSILCGCFADDDFYGGQFDDDTYKNNNNDNGGNNDNANDNGGQDQQQQETSGEMQYFNDDGTIDFTQFAIKFQSCASLNMESFNVEDYSNYNYNNAGDDEEENEEGNDDGNQDDNYSNQYQYPYNTAQVVSYRLCPVDSCKDNSWRGCRKTYGNYMISLEDYIDLHQNDVADRVEQYCDYCKQCTYMLFNYNKRCDYFYDCYTSNYNYTSLCDDDFEAIDYSQYLECTEVDKLQYTEENADDKWLDDVDDYIYNNGNNRKRRMDEDGNGDDKAYVKIYCDGSIKLGLFSDNACTNYIGDSTAVYKATGISGIEDDLNDGVTNSRCLSCAKEKSKYTYQKMQSGYYGNNEEDESFEVCENLVDNSLQCNAKLDTNNQYNQNSATCDMIDSFQKGNIDASGYLITKMDPMFWLVLLFVIPGCIAMVLVIAFFVYTSRTDIEIEDADENLVDSGVRFSDESPMVFT